MLTQLLRTTRGTAAVAWLAVRDTAPAYCTLAALGALAAAGLGLGTPQPEALGEARVALAYGMGWSELAAALTAALAGALTLGRALRRRRAGAELATSLPRGAYLAAHAAAALATATLVAATALGVLLGAVVLQLGDAALHLVSPRTAHAPAEVITADTEGAPVRASGRFAVETGADVLLRFRGVPIPKEGEPLTLRLEPVFVLREGFPGTTELAAEVRVRSAGSAAEGVRSKLRWWAAHRRPSEVHLPPEAARVAPGERRDIDVLLWVESPDSMLSFDLRPDERGHARHGAELRAEHRSPAPGLMALVAGRAATAGVVTLIAIAGATLLAEWTAVALALVLATLARFPELVRAVTRPAANGLQPHATHAHADPATWTELLRQMAQVVSATLPDLGRLDLSAPLLAGRVVPPGDALTLVAGVLPFCACVALLAWLLFRRRDIS
jgi:hypothetical protein